MADPFFSISTPRTPGAIAIIDLTGGGIDEACARLGLPRVTVGGAILADILGVDRGLMIRFSARHLALMPHAGPAIVRTIAARLIEAGVVESTEPDPSAIYPEAESTIEARMLAAIARTPSPRAIDLLLAQPERWAAHAQVQRAGVSPPRRTAPHEHLRHLLDPPLVVLVGPPNIGKSSLTNALARRTVAIEADLPGTTRDHVGVTLELDGLCVHFIDTPGRDNPDDDAQRLARGVIARADLVLSCADARTTPVDPDWPAPTLRVALRSDLGEPAWPCDQSTSAKARTGLDELAVAIRQSLVPDNAMSDPNPWEFW